MLWNSVMKSQCVFLPQTGNVHTFTYDGSAGRRGGEQYTVVRRPDVLVQASHHVLDSGETIVIPGTLASTPLSSSNLTSHHNIDDGQVRIITTNIYCRFYVIFTSFSRHFHVIGRFLKESVVKESIGLMSFLCHFCVIFVSLDDF